MSAFRGDDFDSRILKDDVTLGNPFGPFGRGPSALAKTLAGAAANYRDGTVVSVDLVAKYLNDNMGCGSKGRMIEPKSAAAKPWPNFMFE